MSSDEKIMEEGGEGPSHETPQAITITIMDPSALETTTLDSALVASVEAQSSSSRQADGTLLMVPREGSASISVAGGAKDLLQTVTETHMGTEELPVISNINSSEDTSEQSTIQLVTKTSQGESIKLGEVEEIEELGEYSSRCCLICNEEMQEEHIPVFKSQTTTSHRKVSVFLGGLVGQKLTSRKAHSDIICQKCFALLNKLDLLEVEIRDTKDEIVSKYQESVAVHGGRARRKKPAAARKSDYVFPKIEPEDEDEQAIAMEMDETFEPHVEDLMEEEHDRREDRDSEDEEWEPEFKKTRIKREGPDADGIGPPKRKRGRPRKDAASKPKAELASLMKGEVAEDNEGDDPSSAASGRPNCPVCETSFSFPSQLRRHVRHEHPDFDTQLLPQRSFAFSTKRKLDVTHFEMDEDISTEDQPLVCNLCCSWCDQDFTLKEEYDEHLRDHGEYAYKQYLETMLVNDDEKRNAAAVSAAAKEEKLLSAAEIRDAGQEAPDAFKGESADSVSGKSKDVGDECQLECSLCGFMDHSKVTLERHFDESHRDTSRNCNLCNEHCMDASSLREHVIHHFNGVIHCPVCPTRFSVRHHLLSHWKLCHHSGYILCSECNQEFKNYELYEVHQMDFHGKGAVRICKICEKEVLAFNYYEHLKLHGASSKVGIESSSLSCNFCSDRFECATQLYQHKYHEHPEAFSFKCNECERKCRTERMLNMHKWGHKYGSHQCPVCRLKFRQVDQLKKHLLLAHPDQEGYTCKYCPLTLKNYATYIAHLKFKHPRESGYNRPVRCKVCGASFDHKMQWKYHMRNHSQAIQTCSICGISVKNLDIHMNLHTKTKKFECTVCGAVYHNKASFHFHVKRVHMGDSVRKYLCDVCGKGFLTPADQRIHIARVHQGERNYWCTTCHKRYKSKVSLTYHQRLHTGEKPHKCTLCGRAFRVPSYLKRHMEHDHRAQYLGVYFKQGRPKSQEARGQIRRQAHYQSTEPVTTVDIGQANGSIPEVVQITVPMEMGEEEVVAAVNSVQNVQNSTTRQYKIEQEDVVYVVCEDISM